MHCVDEAKSSLKYIIIFGQVFVHVYLIPNLDILNAQSNLVATLIFLVSILNYKACYVNPQMQVSN